MPETEDFRVEILVGDSAIPEYEQDGEYYVESNLNTPLSYNVRQHDYIDGEAESQSWPVTPYKIRISPKPTSPRRYYDIFVDGVKVKSCSVDGTRDRMVSGFKDKHCVREFLFSLPRFATDEEDRLTTGRETKVGVIEVECYDAMLIATKMKSRKKLDYEQANKKDCSRVTRGNFTMSTTKVGNVLYRKYPYRTVHVWRRLNYRCKVAIHYRMGHCLQEMGFELKPYPILPSRQQYSESSGEESPLPSTSQDIPTGRRRRKRKFNSKTDPIVLGDTDSDSEVETVIIKERKQNKSKETTMVDLTDNVNSGDSEDEGTSIRRTIKTENAEKPAVVSQRKDSDSPLLSLSHNSPVTPSVRQYQRVKVEASNANSPREPNEVSVTTQSEDIV